MPHICGPHSQLPNCSYHSQRSTAGLEPATTWVPIPIQKVRGTEDSQAPSFPTGGSRMTSVPINGFRAPGQGPAVPGYGAPGPQGTTVPVQLAAPGLIMKAKKDANADELFPRKKKSEFCN